jgi:Fe-coproporphyrin III synthase
MEERSPWGMRCSAGRKTIVIEHDGAFKSCETRKPVGSLRDYGFDLGAALNSDAMKNEIDQIGRGKKACCWCTHPCWMDLSLTSSPRTAMTSILYHYFTYILKKYFQAKTRSGLIPEMKKASLLPLRK